MKVGKAKPTVVPLVEAPPEGSKVQRNHSDSSEESNTGWESGSDTDLDLTDHSAEENALLLDNSQQEADKIPIFKPTKRNEMAKLRNPWKKSTGVKAIEGANPTDASFGKLKKSSKGKHHGTPISKKDTA